MNTTHTSLRAMGGSNEQTPVTCNYLAARVARGPANPPRSPSQQPLETPSASTPPPRDLYKEACDARDAFKMEKLGMEAIATCLGLGLLFVAILLGYAMCNIYEQKQTIHDLTHRKAGFVVRRGAIPMEQLVSVVDFQNARFSEELTVPNRSLDQYVASLMRYGRAMNAMAALVSEFVEEYCHLLMICKRVSQTGRDRWDLECPTDELNHSVQAMQHELRMHLRVYGGELSGEDVSKFKLDDVLEQVVASTIDSMHAGYLVEVRLIEDIESMARDIERTLSEMPLR